MFVLKFNHDKLGTANMNTRKIKSCIFREEAYNYPESVDFDLTFTYVLSGWEGSAHDSLILANALQSPDGLKVPQGNN
jgi:hypothetical protein